MADTPVVSGGEQDSDRRHETPVAQASHRRMLCDQRRMGLRGRGND
jgi:hypothetical protein